MTSAASLLAFTTTTLAMNITPGSAVMQVVGHSMSNGWRAPPARLKPRGLDGVSGAALLAAAGSVATSTLRNR